MSSTEIATTTISLFVRHTAKCPKREDSQWKRCNCRKSIYLYEDGKVSYKSAKTRSWEQAEKVAQAMRDQRDPVKIELARIAAVEQVREDARKAAAKAGETSIEAALDQWIAGFKAKPQTASAYATFKKKFLAWCELKKLTNLTDVTGDDLDAWVGSWSPVAEDKLNRIKSHTQAFRLTRIRSFFKWAAALRKLEHNPALVLRSISGKNEVETQPLTPSQFSELLEATYRYDADRRLEKDRFGRDLRAVCLVQRWTGVRLGDALMLPRSGVCGDRLTMDIQKTGGKMTRRVPTVVLDALSEVPARKTMHPDQFFWSRKCDHRVLSGIWIPRFRLLNNYLSFKNDKGEPMMFRTHMLRDTYAVEMLLAGVSLEKVSRLLGHASVAVTEKHYSPWVKRRVDQLENESIAALKGMGAVFREP